MMPTSSAARLRGIEVCSITMDPKDHLASIITYSGVGVCGTVVQEVEHGFLCFCSALGLLTGKVIDGVHHGRVNSSGIKEKSATDLLQGFMLLGSHGYGVCLFGILDTAAIYGGLPRGRAMHRLFWWGMLEAEEGFFDVAWDGQVHCAVVVVPMQMYTTI